MLKLVRRRDAAKGTWRIRGTVGGVRYDESTGTDSRAHAEAILAKRQREILDRHTWGAERTTTFAEAVTSYLTAGGEARFLEPLVRAFGPRRMADIAQPDVDALVAKLHPVATPETISRQIYTPLIAVFRHAHRPGTGPAPAFQRPKLARRAEVRFPTDDEINRIAAVASDRLRAAIVVLTVTGARASELCRIESRDIDWRLGNVILRETKNGDPRRAPIDGTALALLGPLRDTAGPLFGLVSRFSLNQALRRACQRAGVNVYTSHEIGRHAFAARLLANGHTILDVQRAGGWRDYKVVATTYGHLEQSHVDDVMRAAGANLVQKISGAKNVVPLQRSRR